uniref:Putative tick serpins 10 n=1 Tax=Ixodes ricinus TaxID=34613 RepID=V5H7A1_IXORI
MNMKSLVISLSILAISWAQMDDRLTLANNRFGLRLFGVLSSTPDSNVFFSPYSVSTAMAMAYAGVRGEAQQELSQRLEFSAAGLSEEQVLDAYAQHTRRILLVQTNSTLKVANAAAVHGGLTLLASYERTLSRSFYSELLNVDFANEADAAAAFINGWVRQRTQDKIDGIIDGKLDPNTRLMLLNAIYFKGAWNRQFNASLTAKGPFFNGGTAPVQVDVMTGNFDIPYAYFEDLQVDMAELPYRGLDFSMSILLPRHSNALEALKRNLTAELFQSMVSRLREREVNVALPKFKLDTKYLLKEALQTLGIRKIFTSGSDWSGITTDNLSAVSTVIHKAAVEVNEEGSVAAATTGIGIIAISLPPPPVEFRVNHPFLFFIRNTNTNDILFVGHINAL